MSAKVKVYNQKGEAAGEVTLPEGVFGVKVNEALVHQAMVAQMGNMRQVLAHTKDRSEVRGGGRKPWRQKGTGRARAGSSRSPIWIGGGVTFGPRSDRNFKKNINKKMKEKAINMVLSDKLESGSLKVLEKIEAGEFKTKVMEALVSKLENKSDKKNTELKRSMLVINDKKDERVKLSFRNLEGVKFINIDNINIVDLLRYRDLVMTKEVVVKLESRNNPEPRKIAEFTPIAKQFSGLTRGKEVKSKK